MQPAVRGPSTLIDSPLVPLYATTDAYSLPRASVRRFVREGRIPVTKVGRHFFTQPQDLRGLLSSLQPKLDIA